jgi:type IV pilus assembly protein PilE
MKSAGFTLIELMIAVAILAVVMGIAIPSYTQWVIQSGRADGKAELFRVAQVLERCYTRYSTYTANECAIGDGATTESEKGKYQITVDSTAATFTLTAAPQGGQTKDTKCSSLTLTHTGQRGIDGGDGTVDDCW